MTRQIGSVPYSPLVCLVVAEAEGVHKDEQCARDDVDEAEDPRDHEADARPRLIPLLLLMGDVALALQSNNMLRMHHQQVVHSFIHLDLSTY